MRGSRGGIHSQQEPVACKTRRYLCTTARARLSVIYVTLREGTTLIFLENERIRCAPPLSHLTDPLFLLWEDFIPICTLVSFNLALTVLADLRFCLLFLPTRILILLANGIIEALFQLFLSCLETVYARALCVGWNARKQ